MCVCVYICIHIHMFHKMDLCCKYYFLRKCFFNFWLCWVFVAARGLSLVVASRGFSVCARASQCRRLSCGPRVRGSSSCSHGLQSAGSVAPWHVGSSQTGDRTRVPCIARQILKHWTAREAPQYYFFLSHLFSYLDLYLISVLIYIMICITSY